MLVHHRCSRIQEGRRCPPASGSIAAGAGAGAGADATSTTTRRSRLARAPPASTRITGRRHLRGNRAYGDVNDNDVRAATNPTDEGAAVLPRRAEPFARTAAVAAATALGAVAASADRQSGG